MRLAAEEGRVGPLSAGGGEEERWLMRPADGQLRNFLWVQQRGRFRKYRSTAAGTPGNTLKLHWQMVSFKTFCDSITFGQG
jgi:hypothetical protein